MASQEKNRILRYKKTIERITTGKPFFLLTVCSSAYGAPETLQKNVPTRRENWRL
jgi:hypothetical protein